MIYIYRERERERERERGSHLALADIAHDLRRKHRLGIFHVAFQQFPQADVLQVILVCNALGEVLLRLHREAVQDDVFLREREREGE